MNVKIQILAGNTLLSRFHIVFEIELPFVIVRGLFGGQTHMNISFSFFVISKKITES